MGSCPEYHVEIISDFHTQADSTTKEYIELSENRLRCAFKISPTIEVGLEPYPQDQPGKTL